MCKAGSVAPPLLIRLNGDSLLRKAFGLIVAAILPFIAAAALLTPRPVSISLPRDPAADGPMVAPPAGPSIDGEPGETATDLLGNEVTDAVARYKFDATGSLYEVHSPQTEVPHLRAPRT